MLAFILPLGLSIIFAILAIIFLVLSFFKDADKNKYEKMATVFSGLITFISLFNITVPAPIILPLDNETQKYTNDIEITIKSDEDCLFKTYYSLDGLDPKTEGNQYEEEITISESTTVCARNKFLWLWSDINRNTYKFMDIPLVEKPTDEEVSEPMIIEVDGQDVAIDRRTMILLDSSYPDVPMEVKTTSFFLNHRNYNSSTNDELVSDPFISPKDDFDGLYQELIEEILRNPVYGDMIARGLVNDSNLYSDNIPWLNEFINKTDHFFEIETNTEEATGMEKWLMAFEDEPDKWYVSIEYRMYAEKICRLLDEFTNYGVHKFTSDGYWGLFVDLPSHARTHFEERETKLDAFILCRKDTSGHNISILGFDLQGKGLLHYEHFGVDL